MRGLAVITGVVIDRRGHRQRALAECSQVSGRNIQRPGAVIRHGGSVGFAAQRHGDGLARLCTGGAVDGQRLLRFRCVQHVIARQRCNAHHWRSGVHADAVRCRSAVARAVLRRNRYLIVRAIGQRTHIGCRYGGAPAAVTLNGGRIALAVQGHGHHRAAGKLSTGAVNHQRRSGFCCVDHVIAAEGINRQRHGGGIDHHVVGLGAAVARAVGDGCAEGHGAVIERRNHARRYAHAPVTAGINGGGVLV